MFRSYWHVGLALGLACLLWQLTVPAQSAEQKGAANHQPESNTSYEPVDREIFQSSVASIEGDIQALKANKEVISQTDKIQNDFENGFSVFNSIIAFVVMGITGVGTVAIIRTLEHTAVSANAAKDAAKAAMDSVKIARDIGEKQVRAYVGTKDVNAFNFAVGKKPTFIYHAVNSGQTPAYGMRIRAVALWHDEPASPKNFFKYVGPEVSTVDLVSGGDTTLPVSWEKPLSQADMDSFKAGHHKLLFIGYVRYRDIFGKLRRTIFSHALAFEDLRGDGPAIMAATRKHNRSN